MKKSLISIALLGAFTLIGCGGEKSTKPDSMQASDTVAQQQPAQQKQDMPAVVDPNASKEPECN